MRFSCIRSRLRRQIFLCTSAKIQQKSLIIALQYEIIISLPTTIEILYPLIRDVDDTDVPFDVDIDCAVSASDMSRYASASSAVLRSGEPIGVRAMYAFSS